MPHISQAAALGVGNNVYYHGSISHEHLANFYDTLNVYVHPSYTEGLSRAVIEAMSRACPCAVSDAGGTPELIDIEFSHKVGDFQKLAEDLQKLFIDKDARNRASIKNFERSKDFYNTILEQKRKTFYSQFFSL